MTYEETPISSSQVRPATDKVDNTIPVIASIILILVAPVVIWDYVQAKHDDTARLYAVESQVSQ